MKKRTTNENGRKLLGCLLIVVILLVVFALFSFSDVLVAPSYLPAIQAALDAECGAGKFEADVQGFTRDPVSWWDSDSDAVCYYQTDKDEWDCDC